MRKDFLGAFLAVFVSLTLSAQEQKSRASIEGKVFVKESIPDEIYQYLGKKNPGPQERALSRVQATLVLGKDTLKTQSSEAGIFTFKNLPADSSVVLTLKRNGYRTFSGEFPLVPGKNVVLVEMHRGSDNEELDPAKVTAEAPMMTMEGDTLVLHAAAAIRRDGDYAIDLLKQFPGVEIENGSLRISGKPVVRSYVNGALVFGARPMDSMEFLQGDEVTEFRVYDEHNPFKTQEENRTARKERVINIRTKNPIFSVSDFQARILAGADARRQEDGTLLPRYTAGASANLFSEMRIAKADAVFGNLGVESGALSADPYVQQQYRQNAALNLSFEQYWKDRYQGDALTLSYGFRHDRIKSRQRVLREQFETAGIPAQVLDQEDRSGSRKESHNVTSTYEKKTGRVLRFKWANALSYSTSADDRQQSENLLISGKAPMQQDRHFHEGKKAWSIHENLSLSSSKNRYFPTLNLGLSLEKDDTEGWDLDTLVSSYNRRYLTKDGGTVSRRFSAGLSGFFQKNKDFGNGTQVSFRAGSLQASYDYRKKQQAAFDLWGTDRPLPNAANTFEFTYSDLQGIIGTSFWMRKDTTLNGTLSLDGTVDRVIDRERIPSEERVDRNWFSLRPSLSVTFRETLHFNYSMNSQLPAVEQLRARINDNSPLFLIAGNPALQPARTHRFSLQGNRKAIRETMAQGWVRLVPNESLSWSLALNWTRHPIVQRTLYFPEETVLEEYQGYRVPAGASLNRAENADYDLLATAFLRSAKRFSWFQGRWKPKLSIFPSIRYRLQPQYFGQTLDRIQEIQPSLALSAETRFSRILEVNLRTDLSYNRSWSASMDMEALHAGFQADATLELGKNGFLKTTYDGHFSENLTRGSIDARINRLSASLGWKCLQDRLTVSLVGLDLLNGGSAYRTGFSPSSYTQTWSPVYGRCLLLSLAWRTNKAQSGPSILLHSQY